jgi:(S)-2-hydroxyglutarate dehydrogenase
LDGKADVVIVGGGIVGLATAMAIAVDGAHTVIVLEAEQRLATHQTGRNSGVIHSGLYYRPDSLKAENCVRGREAMYAFCEANDIAHERCGKVVVATDPEEIPRLDELERRGRANGLQGVRRLSGEEVREYEPHVTGIAGLHVPQTGIVDYAHVAAAMARRAQQAGAAVHVGARVRGRVETGGEIVVQSAAGDFACRYVVNCAGLQCDRMARKFGASPTARIVPFRGEYHELVPAKHSLVKNLIYPVPDPRYPFLGVHFTRMMGGGVEAGPNAVLALRREGYSKLSFSPRDALGMASYGGFWRMASRHWRTGIMEVHRSLSRAAFVRALQKLIPEVEPGDVRAGGAGVRAQAVADDGSLLDDFSIVETENALHVLNAPSPAATSSISIGETIAARVREQLRA